MTGIMNRKMRNRRKLIKRGTYREYDFSSYIRPNVTVEIINLSTINPIVMDPHVVVFGQKSIIIDKEYHYDMSRLSNRNG